MAGYVIVQAEVLDMGTFREYLAAAPETIAKFGGRYLARAGKVIQFEGEEDNRRLVILEFPSLEKAVEWYQSEEYQTVRELRLGVATGTLIAIEGC